MSHGLLTVGLGRSSSVNPTWFVFWTFNSERRVQLRNVMILVSAGALQIGLSEEEEKVDLSELSVTVPIGSSFLKHGLNH